MTTIEPPSNYLSTSVKLPRGLVDRVDAVARERVVGRNLLIERALEAYLAALPPLPPNRIES